MQKYNKFLVGVLGVIAQVVHANYSTNHYVQVGIAVLTALGIYIVPNKQ